MSLDSVHLAPLHGYSKYTQPSINLLKGLGVAGDAHCGSTVQHLYDRRKTPNKLNLKQVHIMPLELLRCPTFRGYDGLPVLPGEMGENITTQGLDLYSLGEGYKLYFTHRHCWLFTALEHFILLSRSRAYVALTAFAVLAAILSLLLLHNRPLTYAFLLPVLLALTTFPPIVSFCHDYALPSDSPIVRVSGLRKPCQQINDWRDGLLKQCYRWEAGKKRERCGIMGVVERGGEVKGRMRILVVKTRWWKEMICV